MRSRTRTRNDDQFTTLPEIALPTTGRTQEISDVVHFRSTEQQDQATYDSFAYPELRPADAPHGESAHPVGRGGSEASEGRRVGSGSAYLAGQGVLIAGPYEFGHGAMIGDRVGDHVGTTGLQSALELPRSQQPGRHCHPACSTVTEGGHHRLDPRTTGGDRGANDVPTQHPTQLTCRLGRLRVSILGPRVPTRRSNGRSRRRAPPARRVRRVRRVP